MAARILLVALALLGSLQVATCIGRADLGQPRLAQLRGGRSAEAAECTGKGGSNSHHARMLQEQPIGAGNGVLFQGDDGSTYTLYGYDTTGDTMVRDNYPANAWEAKVNCTRLHLEQPDVTKDQDLFAVQYLSAGSTTWVKSQQGKTCTHVTSGSVYGPGWPNTCDSRRLFICVQRHPNVTCGKSSCLWPAPCCGSGAAATCCCGTSTCCDSAVCCHKGTKCCPKKLNRAAYCQALNAAC